MIRRLTILLLIWGCEEPTEQNDCAGVWGGFSYVDVCGICDSDNANDCVQDCAGVWGGFSYVDDCGICDSDNANDCVQDCAAVWGGSAVEDCAGTCGGISPVS